RKGQIQKAERTLRHFERLKRLNQVIFPGSFKDKFYRDVLEKNLKVSSGQNADAQKTENLNYK
uniref:Uncharacterized protein n=1 Tax=Sciurus vulgaris TaxID=55149 RepID=A0A8D2B0X6_SCIVU